MPDSRMLTCTSCRTPVEVVEVPRLHLDPATYVCGECSPNATRPAEPSRPDTDAWWCPACWERHELARTSGRRRLACSDCDTRMHRCSRYEWFLHDALEQQLEETGRAYRIRPQYPIDDHRGFAWYWDLGVWVEGSSPFKGAGLLIDVNGPDHLVQKSYSGPGGGYTRDYDKVWELGQQRLHHRGWDHWIVRNEDCRREVVNETARQIVAHLLAMAGTP